MPVGPPLTWSGDRAGLDSWRFGVLKFEKVFAVDGAVGVEELVGDVAKDGGAAGRDAAFGDEDEESGEELADVGAGGELGEFGKEFGGEVGEIALVLLEGGAEGGAGVVVVATKTEMESGGEFLAAFAVGEKVLAAAFPLCSGFR
jgi:hypothetical protein